MPQKYNIEHFICNESEPTEELQKCLSDIIFMVKKHIADAIDDTATGLANYHLRTIISMVITNVLVNLVDTAICGTVDANRRLTMIQETLDEINDMVIELWHSIEANKADTKTVN